MKKPTVTRFSPHAASKIYGALEGQGMGGINWSYVVFPSEINAKQFETACHTNGYRTRNLHKQPDGNWTVQYHHYED